MERNGGILRIELLMSGAVAVAVCALVVTVPSLVRYATHLGLAAFLMVNALLGSRRKRFTVALAFFTAAVFAFAVDGPLSLALEYVMVFFVILRRCVKAGGANAAPAYILFGYVSNQ